MFLALIFVATSLPAYEMPPVKVTAERVSPPWVSHPAHPWDSIPLFVADRLAVAEWAEFYVDFKPPRRGEANVVPDARAGRCVVGDQLHELLEVLLDDRQYMWSGVICLVSGPDAVPVFGIRFEGPLGSVQLESDTALHCYRIVEPLECVVPGTFNPSFVHQLAVQEFPECNWPHVAPDWEPSWFGRRRPLGSN